jgi:hypothetical protein
MLRVLLCKVLHRHCLLLLLLCATAAAAAATALCRVVDVALIDAVDEGACAVLGQQGTSAGLVKPLTATSVYTAWPGREGGQWLVCREGGGGRRLLCREGGGSMLGVQKKGWCQYMM